MMKKLAISLIACLACLQTVHADVPTANSPFMSSLQYYEAISMHLATNPDFQDIISEDEFISGMRIQKRGISADQGNVFVTIITHIPKKGDEIIPQEEVDCLSKDGSKKHRHYRSRSGKKMHSRISKTYKATLLVTSSDDGQSSVSVVDIQPVFKHSKTYIGNDNADEQVLSEDVKS